MPSASVTAVRVPICCGLVIVTVTPGITASDASVTLPLMAPVPEVTAWAKVRDAENEEQRQGKRKRTTHGYPPGVRLRPMDERTRATPTK